MPATPEIQTESALDRFYNWITEHEDWDEVFKEFSEEELSVTLDLLDTDMPEFLDSVGEEMAAHLLATDGARNSFRTRFAEFIPRSTSDQDPKVILLPSVNLPSRRRAKTLSGH